MSRVDLHTHTNASDGTDTPGALIEKALDAGITALAVTDHDTVAGVRQALPRVPAGLTLIPGVELSCRGAAGKCHLLGLGIDPDSPGLSGILETLAALRREKLEKRIRYLFDRGFVLPEAELDALRALPAAGKPHLAGLLTKYGLADSPGEAFAILKACATGEDRIDAGTAVPAILGAGGVPVWAHPRGGVDGAVGETEFRALLPELVSYGLQGLECFYSLYPMKLCRELARIASQNGLYASAGSDCHGKNKSVPLGKLNAESLPVAPDEITVLGKLLRLSKKP